MKLIRRIALLVAIAMLSSGCVWLQRVSTTAAGTQGSDDVRVLDVSDDGRYVLLDSDVDLDPANDTNGDRDLYRKDMLTGAVHRVTIGDDTGGTNGGRMNADGTRIVFTSNDPNIVADDTNGNYDVFVHDVTTGSTKRFNLTDAGVEGTNVSPNRADISDDGNVVVWSDTGAYVTGYPAGTRQIYRHVIDTGTTTIMSTTSAGIAGNDMSTDATVNGDGSVVAFSSVASNLVGGDTNSEYDIFVKYDSGTILRVNTPLGGAQPVGGPSFRPDLDPGANVIAFDSRATNLVPGDSNGEFDVFVKSTSGAIERVSIADDGTQGTDLSGYPSMSSDGTVVSFSTRAGEINGGLAGTHVAMVRDLANGRTLLGAADSSGSPTQVGGGTLTSPRSPLSGDGNYLVWTSDESSVISPDTNGVRQDVYQRFWSEPQITAVAPATISLGATQPITITGSGFRSDHTFDLFTNRFANDGVSFANVVVVDDTTITADITTTVGLTTLGDKSLWIEVFGTGPGSDTGSLTSCGGCFSVAL